MTDGLVIDDFLLLLRLFRMSPLKDQRTIITPALSSIIYPSIYQFKAQAILTCLFVIIYLFDCGFYLYKEGT